MPIRIAIVDDHPIVLDGLAQLFQLEPDLEIVHRCSGGEQVLDALREQEVDVLLLDLKLPGMDGLAVLGAVRAAGLTAKVLLLTAAIADDQLAHAFHLGVSGVVLKEVAPRVLIQAVRTVQAGGLWLDEGFGGTIDQLLKKSSAAREASQLLTKRELEIVRMAASGLRNRAIGERLFISEATVKIHLHNIYQKLKLNGRLDLAAFAHRSGLV